MMHTDDDLRTLLTWWDQSDEFDRQRIAFWWPRRNSKPSPTCPRLMLRWLLRQMRRRREKRHAALEQLGRRTRCVGCNYRQPAADSSLCTTCRRQFDTRRNLLTTAR